MPALATARVHEHTHSPRNHAFAFCSGIRPLHTGRRTVISAGQPARDTHPTRRATARSCVARYYDPATGAFLNRDPITSITQAPYAYADDNPTNMVDPSGLLFGVNWDDVKNTASDAWNATGGKVVHAAKEGGEALGTAAVDTGEFVWENRGTIATGIAIGGCLAPGVGLAVCGGLAATAFLARSSQRIEDRGFSNRTISRDGLLRVLARYPYFNQRVRIGGGRCCEGDIEGAGDRPEGSA